MRTTRLESLSDGVFSVALTLLILNFKLPSTTEGLGPALLGLWPQFIGYSISVLLVGAIWASHHAMFLHIKQVDRVLLFLNTLLLADVAFLPFPTAVLANSISSGKDLVIATMFYGGVLTIGGVLFNAIWLYASLLTPRLHDDANRTHIWKASLRFGFGPIAYLFSALCALISPYLSILMYAILIAYYWFPGRTEVLLTLPDPKVAGPDVDA